jgi:beta-glucosidase
MRRFPDGFLWGAATSAYQIEGATRADGRGESIWDRFAATPGTVSDGSDGAVACDHYHRWPEDVRLMQSLGLQAYRFSIAWPRIFPSGRAVVNPAGLAFYDRLVDGLLAAGIAPMATLYHWDLPQALEDAGGWATRAIVDAYLDFVDEVTRRLGDRVRCFITHNEPWCVSVLGYADGLHAPGRRDWPAALACAHHLLLSHGLAVPLIRANVRDAEVGIALNLVPAEPASPSAADLDACRAFDGTFNRWFLDPLHGRPYPADVLADHVAAGRIPSADLPFVEPGDAAAIATPTDFLGINYYSRAVLRSERVPEADNAPRLVHPSSDRTDLGWEVYPDGLRALLLRVHHDYGPPRLYITENGAAYATPPDAGGPSTTSSASATCAATSRPRSTPATPACRWPATSSGRSSTTTNGRRAIRSASASSGSTSPRKSACPRSRRRCFAPSSPTMACPRSSRSGWAADEPVAAGARGARGAAGAVERGDRGDRARAARRARLQAGRRRPRLLRLRHELELYADRTELQLFTVDPARFGDRGGAPPRYDFIARYGRQCHSPICRYPAPLGAIHFRALRNLCRFESAHGPLRHRRQRRVRRQRRLRPPRAPTGDPGPADRGARPLSRHARRAHVDARQ